MKNFTKPTFRENRLFNLTDYQNLSLCSKCTTKWSSRSKTIAIRSTRRGNPRISTRIDTSMCCLVGSFRSCRNHLKLFLTIHKLRLNINLSKINPVIIRLKMRQILDDHNRIKLTEGVESKVHTDYINASPLRIDSVGRSYILAQVNSVS